MKLLLLRVMMQKSKRKVKQKMKKIKMKVKYRKIVKMKKMRILMKNPKFQIIQQLLRTHQKMKLLLKKSLLEGNSTYSN